MASKATETGLKYIEVITFFDKIFKIFSNPTVATALANDASLATSFVTYIVRFSLAPTDALLNKHEPEYFEDKI